MIYSYRCSECDREHEISKPMSEASSKEVCPDCGSFLKRIFKPIPFTWHDNCRGYDNDGWGDELVLTHHD